MPLMQKGAYATWAFDFVFEGSVVLTMQPLRDCVLCRIRIFPLTCTWDEGHHIRMSVSVCVCVCVCVSICLSVDGCGHMFLHHHVPLGSGIGSSYEVFVTPLATGW